MSPAAVAAAAEPKPSGARWLPVVEPHLAPVLVSPRQRQRIRALASVLPHDALYAIEAPLAGATGGVDLSLRLQRPAQAQAAAPLLAPGHRRDFLTSWATAKSSGTQPIPEVWLEFDLQEGLRTAVPEPLICARLRPDLDASRLLSTLLPQLLGRPMAPRLEKRIVSCLRALGPDTQLLYAFDLTARPGRLLRLEVYSPRFTSLIEYGRRCLPAEAAERCLSMEDLCADGDRFHLSFDLDAGGRVAGRLGIESSYQRLPHREPRWRGLFDRLVEAGLCRDAEASAVFRWPGSDAAGRCEAWPSGAVGHCARCLSHVKIVTWPERRPQAKVYLLYQQVMKDAAGTAAA